MENRGDYAAQAQVGLAVHGQSAEPTIPDAPRIQQELAALYSGFSDSSDALHKIANELFGPPPPSVVVGQDAPLKGQGAIDIIHQQLASLRDRAQELRAVIARFNRLI